MRETHLRLKKNDYKVESTNTVESCCLTTMELAGLLLDEDKESSLVTVRGQAINELNDKLYFQKYTRGG